MLARILTMALAFSVLLQSTVSGIQVSMTADHDLSGPTYGLEGKTSSQMHYDERNGLNLKGTIGDILGPPIKIANGFQNIFKGNELASVGSGLKTGGALLGLDAKILETAGAGNLIKGGLLLGGAKYKTNLAGLVGGPAGKKIASIIEVPIKVVAMKDLAEGKVLSGLGGIKHVGALAMGDKGQRLINQGQAMKAQGLNQMIQGTSEGVQNIGNMVAKTAENVSSAMRLLPIVWDMQQQQAMQQHQQQEEATKGQQQQQHLASNSYQSSPGGSLFGGLASLLTPGSGLNAQGYAPGMAPNPSYAALWNSTSPLTNLLMNPAANPFLFPLTSGPFGQAVAGMQPIGTAEAVGGGQNLEGIKGGAGPGAQTFDFNLFPGLKYKETVQSQLPTFGIEKPFGNAGGSKQHQQHQDKQTPVQHQDKQAPVQLQQQVKS